MLGLCKDCGYLLYLGKTTINKNKHQLQRQIGKSGVVVIVAVVFVVVVVVVK